MAGTIRRSFSDLSPGGDTRVVQRRVWLAVAVAIATVGFEDAAATEAGPSPQQRLYRIFDRIWDWKLRSYPEFATYVGVPGHDDRWTDLSSAAIARRQQELQGFLRELDALGDSDLDDDARLDRELVVRGLREELEIGRASCR